MHAEQLQEHENRGRAFAQALIAAGFTDPEVRDASFGPAVRLARCTGEFDCALLTYPKQSDYYRGMARIHLSSRSGVAFAFVAGVIAELEARSTADA